MPSAPRRPEVLAPAGDRPSMEAAVRAGADAVYFGVRGFNARARAANFEPHELGETLAYLHRHGVKGYVTLNTLVFDDELPAVEQTIRAAAEAGADAIIVQDLGVAKLARAIAPSLPLHASTQMTCTDAGAVALAHGLGAKRVVLARELSTDDIAAIRRATDVELEVFVHGALCIAYSGQCLTSEALGGRSANRGACAQACRLPYELVVDGEVRPVEDAAYLLSPQDLEASTVVPRLIELGVTSFKIEGRLKTPAYVAATTRLYREAIVAAEGKRAVDGEVRRTALQMYSRGSGPGFLRGVNHQKLVEGRGCEHRGLQVGACTGSKMLRGKTYLRVGLRQPIARGDGLVVEGGLAGEGEIGGRIWALVDGEREVERAGAGREVLIWFGPDRDVATAEVGRRVFRTHDPAAEKAVRSWLDTMVRTMAVDVAVTGEVGGVARFEAQTERGVHAVVSGDAPIATGPVALDQATVRAQLGRLGGTPFELGGLELRLPQGASLPVSSLNRARRALVEALVEALIAAGTTSHATQAISSADLLADGRKGGASGRALPAGLFVLCRNVGQARAALAAGADGVYLDFLELTGTGQAFRQLRAEGAAFLGVAPPRIRKPGEEKIDRFLLGLGPDAVLVRGLGALWDLPAGEDAPCFVGDFSLNITNRIAAAEVLGRGLAAFTPSFDLDGTQLRALLDGPLAAAAEVVVHNPMPLFHMEHCVIAALLSEGADHRTCGRPCDRHQLALRDRAGMDHPVEADVGCRNTVFHAAAQSAAAVIPPLMRQGVSRFRIELVREQTDEVARIVQGYRALLAGQVKPQALWRDLKAVGGYGVVSGSLRVVS